MFRMRAFSAIAMVIALLLGLLVLLDGTAAASTTKQAKVTVSCSKAQGQVKSVRVEVATLTKQSAKSQGPAGVTVERHLSAAKAKLHKVSKTAKASCKGLKKTKKAPRAPPVVDSTTHALTLIKMEIATTFPGFTAHASLAVGTKNITWTKHSETRGIAAFSTVTLKTPTDVANFLNGPSPQSQAAKARVIAAYKATGETAYLPTALNGSAYIPFQMKVASEILGTSYFQNGQVYVEGTGQWRSVGPYDVIWIPVTPDAKLIKGAAVRADCGNPHLTKVIPVIPGQTPPAIPVACPQASPSCQPVFPPCPCQASPPPAPPTTKPCPCTTKVREVSSPPGTGYAPPTTIPGSPPVATTSPTIPASPPGTPIKTGTIPSTGATSGATAGLPGGVGCTPEPTCSGGGTPTPPGTKDTTTLGGTSSGIGANGTSNGTGGTTTVPKPG